MILVSLNRIPAKILQAVYARWHFFGLAALLVISVWSVAAFNVESVPPPPPPAKTIEAAQPPLVRPPPGQDVLTLQHDIEAMLDTFSGPLLHTRRSSTQMDRSKMGLFEGT
jgi:hypothetical protein